MAKKNYKMAGEDVREDEDQINIYSYLRNDQVHHFIQEVVHEVKLPYSLSDF